MHENQEPKTNMKLTFQPGPAFPLAQANHMPLAGPPSKEWRQLVLQARAACFVAVFMWLWVKNRYPKWLALVNGLPMTKTGGPYPGGSILTHTHVSRSPVSCFVLCAWDPSLRTSALRIGSGPILAIGSPPAAAVPGGPVLWVW